MTDNKECYQTNKECICECHYGGSIFGNWGCPKECCGK